MCVVLRPEDWRSYTPAWRLMSACDQTMIKLTCVMKFWLHLCVLRMCEYNGVAWVKSVHGQRFVTYQSKLKCDLFSLFHFHIMNEYYHTNSIHKLHIWHIWPFYSLLKNSYVNQFNICQAQDNEKSRSLDNSKDERNNKTLCLCTKTKSHSTKLLSNCYLIFSHRHHNLAYRNYVTFTLTRVGYFELFFNQHSER